MKNTRHWKYLAELAVLTASAVAAVCQAQEAAQAPAIALKLSESIAHGRLLLEVRPRYARITETAKPEATDAWTVRTMLGWQTAPFHDFRLTAQYIHTSIVGPKYMNDDPARIPTSAYPLLPDPANHSINQLFVDYSGVPATRLRVGRQILRIDDQRFISDVDFRQTPQVFDGATIVNTSLPGIEIQLGEYRRMHTVLDRTNKLRLHILHAAWNPAPDHTLAAYGYWHDQAATGSQTGFSNNAQRINGAHAEGGFSLNDTWRWTYYLAYARQNRINRGDARINADYTRIGAGFSTSMSGVRIDHEVKGSNRGVYGFQTPLTDFYAFNGWALQYTSTPREGLRDTWFTARHQIDKLEFFMEVHRFRSDFGGLMLGRELDVGLTYPVLNNLEIKLQHAQFKAGSGARATNDVDKTWLAFTYRY